MKNNTLILYFLFNALVISGQQIEGFEYHSAFIPEEHEKAILIDGNISEWTWVTGKYKIRHNVLLNTEGTVQNNNDFSVDFFTAWSFYSDYYYIVGTIYDDTINVNGDFPDDLIDILINPSQINADYWSSTYKYYSFNLLRLFIKIDTTPNYEIIYGPNWFVGNPEYFFCRLKTLKDKGCHLTQFEIRFRLMEYISLYGSELSIKGQYKIGDRIGLNVSFDDVDLKNSERDVEFRTYSSLIFWHRAGGEPSFILDKPATNLSEIDKLMLLKF